MATPAQITANRANAQKSTGPRSVEGKSASRFNALKHGIDAASIVIPGEDPADYDALAADYHCDLHPQSTSEAFNVQTMLRADWQKRRLQRVEADLFRTLLAESPGACLAAALLSESPAAKLLARVQRQIAAFERTWYRANAELRRGRKHIEDPAGQSLVNHLEHFFATPTPPDSPELASFPHPEDNPLPDSPAALTSPRNWPPTDEKTGRPLYFVG
jgi:hypothetical protein